MTSFYVLGLLIGSPSSPVGAADVYRVGVLALGEGAGRDFKAFRDRLNSLGYAEGHNLVFERRSASGQTERLPALAADLVQLNVDVTITITTPPHWWPKRRRAPFRSSWPVASIRLNSAWWQASRGRAET